MGVVSEEVIDWILVEKKPHENYWEDCELNGHKFLLSVVDEKKRWLASRSMKRALARCRSIGGPFPATYRKPHPGDDQFRLHAVPNSRWQWEPAVFHHAVKLALDLVEAAQDQGEAVGGGHGGGRGPS